MLLEYLQANYKKGEPIFLKDVVGESGMESESVKRSMRKLASDGRIWRYSPGVYYFPEYSSVFKGHECYLKLPGYVVVECKYIGYRGKVQGYYSGNISMANRFGLTTQIPATEEITTNLIKRRRYEIQTIDGFKFILHRARTEINASNVKSLQFLELVTYAEKWIDWEPWFPSDWPENEINRCLKGFAKNNSLTKKMVYSLLDVFPAETAKKLFNNGYYRFLA